MTDTKHPAEVLADGLKSVAEMHDINGLEQHAAMLRHIPALEAEIETLKEHLQFVERWANHHGAKPSVTAKEALSVIQHYPPIKRITQSYADGVVPSTPNPFERQPLTDEQINKIRWEWVDSKGGYFEFARTIEREVRKQYE